MQQTTQQASELAVFELGRKHRLRMGQIHTPVSSFVYNDERTSRVRGSRGSRGRRGRGAGVEGVLEQPMWPCGCSVQVQNVWPSD